MRSRLPRQPVLASNSSAAQPSISLNAWSVRTNAVSSLTPSHWRGHSLHKELLLLVERSEAQNFWAFFYFTRAKSDTSRKIIRARSKMPKGRSAITTIRHQGGEAEVGTGSITPSIFKSTISPKLF